MLATNEVRQTGNVLVLCVCAKTVGVEMERVHTGREGALDVEPDAVSDMDGTIGGHSDGVESCAEDSRVRLFGTNVRGVDHGGDRGTGAGPDLADAGILEVPFHPALRVRNDRDAVTKCDVRSAMADSEITVVQDGVPTSKIAASASTKSRRPRETSSASRYAAM
jgi:hypothetical protein